MMDTKICINCNIEKPRTKFYPCSTTVDRRTDMCIDCYLKAREVGTYTGGKYKKKVEDTIVKLGAWAKNQVVFCPSPTSKCWLSYDKGLCCCECLGKDICDSPDKCINNVEECMKWYRRK